MQVRDLQPFLQGQIPPRSLCLRTRDSPTRRLTPTPSSSSIHPDSIARSSQRRALSHQHPKPRLLLHQLILRPHVQHLTKIECCDDRLNSPLAPGHSPASTRNAPNRWQVRIQVLSRGRDQIEEQGHGRCQPLRATLKRPGHPGGWSVPQLALDHTHSQVFRYRCVTTGPPGQRRTPYSPVKHWDVGGFSWRYRWDLNPKSHPVTAWWKVSFRVKSTILGHQNVS